MYVAIYRFSCKYKEIMAGTYCGDLFEGTNHAITIDILKGAMRKFAFDTPGILKLELSGQVILDFLLDHFVPAVLYYDSAYCTDGQAPSKADKSFSPSSPAITSRITKTPEPALNLLTCTSGC